MPLYNTDYDGNLRGSTWDAGAFEYGSSAPSDTTPPVVTITNPINGATVSGSVVVTATATDNIGVVGVQFKLDGAYLGTEDTSSPYSINWNTATTTNAAHTLTATARDAAGNSLSHSVSITVNNVVTQPSSPVLIAAYAFNEGSGTVSTDVSGKNHTLTITGAAWNNTGKYSNSLTFDGINNTVSANSATDLALSTGMTVSAWVYPTSTLSTFRSIVLKDYVYYLYASNTSGLPHAGIYTSTGLNYEVFKPAPLPVNTWTHLASTYDGTTLRLYVNGVEVSNRPASGTIVSTNSQTTDGKLWIGGNSAYGEFFPGKIDDIRIYNGALSQTAIQTDMNTPLASTSIPPVDTALKTAYAFEEGTGSSVTDSSGNGGTGTISGAAWNTTGKFGNSLTFDGINDFISVADSAALKPTTAFTLESWVYPTTVTSDRCVLAKEGDAYFLYANDGASNHPYVGGHFGTFANTQNVFGTSTLPLNTWTHLAGTYNGSSLKLYINGVEVANAAITGLVRNDALPFYIGKSFYGEYFAGRADNVRVYNRALTQSEIQANMTTAVIVVQDTIPPTISSIASGTFTSSSARITWTTDEASDTQVEYGLTTSYGATSTLNASLVTSHTVDLVGLTESTTYHYRVKSKDAANNLSLSGDNTFSTVAAADVTAPTISGVGTANLTPTSVTINWTTNEGADSQVEYGATTAYENGSTILNPSLVTSHSVNLSMLTASALYHYRPKSRDGAGNLRTGNDATFTTATPPDSTGPIISNVLNSNPTVSSTIVTWFTDEASTSVVEYGTTTSYGNTANDSSLVLSHSVSVTGLSAGTLYHYRVKSADVTGNLTTGSDNSFTTSVAPDTTAPVISNVLPSGVLSSGTTQVTISCVTNELATVKYSTSSGVSYGSMTDIFTITGGTSHSVLITGLVSGTAYTYYLKSVDVIGNVNVVDKILSFSIAATPPQPQPASITVNSPNGNENWKIGSIRQIQWSSNGVTTNVNIELLRNGSYVTLFSNLANLGTANWVVTSGRDNFCKIRITTVDGTVTDSSNNFFKIT